MVQNLPINSIPPKIWGKSGWTYLFSVCLGYPKKPTKSDRERYKAFFESMQYVIPCSKCREGYSKDLKTNNIDKYLDSNTKLVTWLIKMVNSTLPPNKKIGNIHDIISKYFRETNLGVKNYLKLIYK